MLIPHRSIGILVFVLASLLAAVSTVSFAAPPPGAGNPNKGNSASKGPNTGGFWYGNSSNSDVTNLITAGITLVAARQLALDAGVVGFQPLPPGIAKNLARGKPLPPGIANRQLPDSLLRGLPQYQGYQWLGAGTDLILVNMASRVVADVLINALK